MLYRPKIKVHSQADIDNWKRLINAKRQQDKSLQRWLVVSDVHRPFHNQTLWNKLLQLINDMGTGLHGIVLAGDYLDLYTLGSYNNESLANYLV